MLQKNVYLSTSNTSSRLANSCIIEEWRQQTTRSWIWTHIFRNKSNCTFKCSFIKLIQSCWCFVTTSRVCNEMMKIIYQANCRLGARTVVTRIWILGLLYTRISLPVVTIPTPVKVVPNAKPPVTAIATSIVCVFHDSEVVWRNIRILSHEQEQVE
jgi:hypothetical protein